MTQQNPRDRFQLIFAFLVGAGIGITWYAYRGHGWTGAITAVSVASLSLGLLWLAFTHRTRNQ